jgi:hypothetical protein
MRILYSFWLALGALAAFGAVAMTFSSENEAQDPAAIERISPEEARAEVQSGNAILVCAYSDKQCEGKMLEGAITRRELEERLPSLSKDQELILYCG